MCFWSLTFYNLNVCCFVTMTGAGWLRQGTVGSQQFIFRSLDDWECDTESLFGRVPFGSTLLVIDEMREIEKQFTKGRKDRIRHRRNKNTPIEPSRVIRALNGINCNCSNLCRCRLS